MGVGVAPLGADEGGAGVGLQVDDRVGAAGQQLGGPGQALGRVDGVGVTVVAMAGPHRGATVARPVQRGREGLHADHGELLVLVGRRALR